MKAECANQIARRFGQLRVLGVWRNYIGSEGVQILAKRLCHLEELIVGI
jgi:hypothetical protein